MILQNESQYQEAAKEILGRFSSNWKYRILRVAHLGSDRNRTKLEYSIELMDVILFFQRINEMYERQNISKEINMDVFYTAMKHIVKEKPFSDSQLKEFFQAWKEADTLIDSMSDLLEHDDYYYSYDIDFLLLGITHKEVEEAFKDPGEEMIELRENFGNLKMQMAMGKISVEDFIKQAREVIAPLREMGSKKAV